MLSSAMEDPDNEELLSLQLLKTKKKKGRKKVDMTQLETQIAELATQTATNTTDTTPVNSDQPLAINEVIDGSIT
jgi:hypothetical protein